MIANFSHEINHFIIISDTGFFELFLNSEQLRSIAEDSFSTESLSVPFFYLGLAKFNVSAVEEELTMRQYEDIETTEVSYLPVNVMHS